MPPKRRPRIHFLTGRMKCKVCSGYTRPPRHRDSQTGGGFWNSRPFADESSRRHGSEILAARLRTPLLRRCSQRVCSSAQHKTQETQVTVSKKHQHIHIMPNMNAIKPCALSHIKTVIGVLVRPDSAITVANAKNSEAKRLVASVSLS